MERKASQDFGAFANRTNANRNGTLMINSALGNLQNFPDLDAITKSKSGQNEIMAIMKMVAANACKIGFARAIDAGISPHDFQCLLHSNDELGKSTKDDMLTFRSLFH